MGKKKEKPRFLTVSDAAEATGKNISTMFRKLKKVGVEKQMYVKDEGIFFPVGERTITVVDMDKLETKD